MELQVKLKDLLKEHNITQKELAQRTGLTEAQISTIASNRTKSLNKEHIWLIADAIGAKEFNHIFEWK